MPRSIKPQPEPLYYIEEGIATIAVYRNKHLPFYRGSNTHYARVRLIEFCLRILLRARDIANLKTSGRLAKQKFVDMRMNAKILAREVNKRIGKKRNVRKIEDICRAALRLYALTKDDGVRANYSVHSPYTLDIQGIDNQE